MFKPSTRGGELGGRQGKRNISSTPIAISTRPHRIKHVPHLSEKDTLRLDITHPMIIPEIKSLRYNHVIIVLQ